MTIPCPNTEPYCKCINWKDEDFDVEVDHLIHNFEFLRLEMTYSVLDETSPIRLCEIGRCRKCRGRICIGATESHAGLVSKRLEWLYFTGRNSIVRISGIRWQRPVRTYCPFRRWPVS